MKTGIGELLRQAREAQGSSYEEIAWRLRIRPDAIRALEEENFDEIGHSAFVRTHLRSYAKLLGLDSGDLLRRFRKHHETESSSPIAALDEAEKVSRKHIPRSRWFLAATLAIVLLVGGSVMGLIRGPGNPSLTAQRQSYPVNPRIQYEPASRSLSEALTNQVSLRIVATKATQLTVVVDGQHSFSGTIAPGASRLFTGSSEIDMSVADVSALQVWANNARVLAPKNGWWRITVTHSGISH
ncbi:MAG: helix-turn-helix domain-containing protein [Actinomycetota bacterium]